MRDLSRKEIIEECKRRLLQAKSDIINRVKTSRKDYQERDSRGDEADQSAALLEENQLLTTIERFRSQLVEIEAALARIERGTYGICEETEEPIEAERLLAIPWTRLSIEGAEIKESLRHRFAK